MTSADPSAAARPAPFRPGRPGFTVVLSGAMAVTALAIDTILPAFGGIREALGLAPDSTAVAGLVTAFMAGFGLGHLPAGLLADRFGRRPVLWGGLVIYLVGAVAVLLAPNLGVMLAARVVWGFGSAGPRVATLAMVRDAFEGDRMARQMSQIMAVFLIAPMVAPSIGAALLHVGDWHLTVIFPIVIAAIVGAASLGLPATMPAAERRPIAVGAVAADWKAVVTTPGSVAYLMAATILFGTFMAYISSSEAIFGEMYDLEAWFPVIFGGVALALAASISLNGGIVERFGLAAMLTGTTLVLAGAAIALLLASVISDGVPGFWIFIVLLTIVLTATQSLQTNLNAAAMYPLGQIAGSAAALFGVVPIVAGSAVAALISSRFDGTATLLAGSFVAAAVVTWFGIRHALRVAPLPPPGATDDSQPTSAAIRSG